MLIVLPTYTALASAVQSALANWSSYTSFSQTFENTALPASGTTFVDEGPLALAVTRSGVAVQSSNSPLNAVNNLGSYYFNGASSFSVPAAAALVLGTGDFTIECWFNRTVAAGDSTLLGNAASGVQTSWIFYVQTNGTLVFSGGAGSWMISSASIALNTWNHAAVVRASGVTTMYLNGVAIASTSTAISLSGSTTTYVAQAAVGISALTGYLTNARIIKGTAIYTSAFTVPTTRLISVTNTVLLVDCATDKFESSATGLAMTAVGVPRLVAKSPFTSVLTEHASVYLEGSLTSTVPALGTSDFTIECSFYGATYAQSQPGIMGNLVGSAGGDASWAIVASSSNVRFTGWLTNWITSNVAPKRNDWNHVAVVRLGSTITMYLNGAAVGSANASTINLAYTSNTCVGTQGTVGFPFTTFITGVRIVKGTAVYTAPFTVPTTELQAITGTQLLLTCRTLQNTAYLDQSDIRSPVTVTGTPIQTQFSPFSPNGWSTYFNGTSGSIKYPASAAFDLGASDWTMECWFKTDAVITSNSVLVALGLNGGAQTPYLPIYLTSTGIIVEEVSAIAGQWSISASFVPSIGRWYHVAAVRRANVIYLYVDGALVGSRAWAAAHLSGMAFNVGAMQYGGSGSTWYFKGTVSNARLVKGTAIYTTTFSPSTSQLTAVAGTSALTCVDGQIIDRSTNNFALAAVGALATVCTSPFTPTAVYDPAIHGGSVYMDTVADTPLTIPSSKLFDLTGDFTFEAWVYPTAFSTDWGLIDARTTAATPTDYLFYIKASGVFGWYPSTQQTSSLTVKLNQWNHIVITRISGTVKFFLNGVLDATTYSNAGTKLCGTNTIYLGQHTKDSTGSGSAYRGTGYISGMRLVNGTALYTSAFNVPTAPPQVVDKTVLLVNFANAAVADQVQLRSVATVGSAHSNSSHFRSGARSLTLNGTTDWLRINNPQQIGTSDFTAEAWVLPTRLPGSAEVIVGGNVSGEFQFYRAADGKLACGYYGALLIASSSELLSNMWTHIAASRQGTTLRIFIDGVLSGTVTNSTNFGFSGPAYIGCCNGGLYPYKGYIDDLTVTIGQAKYTSTFTSTPETSIYSVLDTSLAFGTAGVTFTPDGMTAAIGGLKAVRSAIGMSSGKHYWETKVNSWSSTYAPEFGVVSSGVTEASFEAATSYYMWAAGGSSDPALATNGVSTPYGANVVPGDIIGTLLDLDAHTLTFYKNGVSLGVAATDLPALVYHAAAASPGATYPCNLTFNFGELTFAYPVEGAVGIFK